MRFEFVHKVITLLLFATSCGGREITGTDGNTHWLKCEDDDDCSNHTCVDGFCRPEGDESDVDAVTSSQSPDRSSGDVNPVAPTDAVDPDPPEPDVTRPLEYASSTPGALGAACIPNDEYSSTFRGFSYKGIYLSPSEQCDSNLCLVNHFQGRVTCPYGSDGADGDECITADGSALVEATVSPQLIARQPEQAVYCSCRCDGPDPEAEYCACGEGFECKEATTLSLPGSEDFLGSYCVAAGTDALPDSINMQRCDFYDAEYACGTSQQRTPESLGVAPAVPVELTPSTEILLELFIWNGGDPCLPRELPLTTDESGATRASCRIFEAFANDDQACERPGRKQISSTEAAAVLDAMEVSHVCESDCDEYTICEFEQLTASSNPNDGEACLNGEEPTGDGWCYIDPAAGLGSEDLVSHCPAEHHRRVRFTGNPEDRDLMYLYCMGATSR